MSELDKIICKHIVFENGSYIVVENGSLKDKDRIWVITNEAKVICNYCYDELDKKGETLSETDITAKKEQKVIGVPFTKDDPRINREGRPKGSISVIGRLKEMFKENPKEFEEFVESYRKNPDNQKHITEMIDGRPKQTIAGDRENPLRIVTVDKDLADINDIIPTRETEDDSEGQA